ncbi:MAG: hypothetical protein AAF998_11690 [Bacteroidota bacterium]
MVGRPFLLYLLCEGLFFFVTVAGLGCMPASDNTSSTATTMNSDALTSSSADTITFSFSAEYRGVIGYGAVFHCAVQDWAQDTISLTVLVKDAAVQAQLEAMAAGEMVRGTFARDQENVPYKRMPITGFVDRTKTAWRLVKLGE